MHKLYSKRTQPIRKCKLNLKLHKNNNPKKANSKNLINCANFNLNKIMAKDTQNMSQIAVSLDAILAAIPPFDGMKNKNITNFLQQFENFAQVANLTEELKILFLKSKITGKAKEIVDANPDIQATKTLNELADKLKEEFRSTPSAAKSHNELMGLKQKPTQNIDDFARAINCKAAQFLAESGQTEKAGAKDLLELVKFNKFMEGMRPDIAFEVRKAGPQNFSQAIKLAKQIEVALTANEETANSLITQNTDSTLFKTILDLTAAHKEEINSLNQKIAELSINKNTQQNQNYTRKFCHVCQLYGHDTQSCWYNSRANPQQRVTPYNAWETHQNYQNAPQQQNTQYEEQPSTSYGHRNGNFRNQSRYHHNSNYRNQRGARGNKYSSKQTYQRNGSGNE